MEIETGKRENIMKNEHGQPSLMVHFAKHVVNPLTLRLAHSSFGPFAVVHHVGRRSGKPYETPIIVRPIEDGGFAIALTYGDGVDWYRNVLAAGTFSLLWHGKTYAITQMKPIAVEEALPLFSPLEQVVLRLRGTDHFVRLS